MATVMTGTRRAAVRWWFAVAMVLCSRGIAQGPGDGELLDATEYRGELEEVVVTAKQPEWRRPAKNDREWRPERFELPESEEAARLDWLPRYTREERDKYDGVRDRMGEKAEFRLFDWKF